MDLGNEIEDDENPAVQPCNVTRAEGEANRHYVGRHIVENYAEIEPLLRRRT